MRTVLEPGVADGRAGRVDRLGRRHAAAEPATRREQQSLPDPAVGAGQEPGERGAVAGRAAALCGLAPAVWLLVETLVDTSRYTGHCYRAANWIRLGETTGRGRMDREHLRHGAATKTVLVYPLVRDAAPLLRQA